MTSNRTLPNTNSLIQTVIQIGRVMNNSIEEPKSKQTQKCWKINLTSVSTATLLLTRSVVVIATAAEFALQMPYEISNP